MFKRKSSTTDLRQPSQGLGRSRGLEYYGSPRARFGTGQKQPAPRPKAAGPDQTKTQSASKPKRLLAFGVALILALGALYDLTLSSNPKVAVLNNASSLAVNFLQPISVYASAAKQMLDGSIMSRTKLTINAAKIEKKLEAKFPELSNVTIGLPLIGRQPTVNLMLASPALILISQNGGTYVLGATGKSISQISSTQASTIKLPIVYDQSGLNAAAGRSVLTGPDLSFIDLVDAAFTSSKFKIQSLTLPPASGELDVRLVGEPYFVKLNLYDNASGKQQVGAFLATAQYLAGKGITPSQYVDVQVPGRVYYK